MNTVSPEWQRELERQQRLLEAIQSTGSFAALDGWAAVSAPAARTATTQRRLGAYVAHAGATAERVLSAAYPTVQALVGDEAFALLARALWRRHPPQRGDVGWFGEALPVFIAGDEQLADVPYLSDVARLEWALARAESAADATPDTASFQWLTEVDPEALHAVLAPGAALIPSVWPIHTVWQAHQASADEPERFAAARTALQAQVGETAWVWRAGWKARACSVGAADARFLQALTEQASLGQALNEAGADFDFAACLQLGLTQGWWLGMRRH
ncbi:MAG: DNA-binding domain-containing protein [Pseudomonadota bacterium]